MSTPAAPGSIVRKRALRRQLREALKDMDPRQRQAKERAIIRELEATLAGARVVGGFWPLDGEPDVRPWLRALARSGVMVAFPRVEGDELRFCAVRDPDRDLRPGFRGIKEPGAGLVPCPAAAMDAVVVPGLAFSRCGARLGRGGGHYDRWLTTSRPPRVLGVAFAVQVLQRLPEDPWDARVDAIVTEGGVTAVIPPS